MFEGQYICQSHFYFLVEVLSKTGRAIITIEPPPVIASPDEYREEAIPSTLTVLQGIMQKRNARLPRPELHSGLVMTGKCRHGERTQ